MPIAIDTGTDEKPTKRAKATTFAKVRIPEFHLGVSTPKV
jgi:hypothetical protein